MGFANVQAEWVAQRQQSLLYLLQPSTSSLYCSFGSGKSFLSGHEVQTFVQSGIQSSFLFPFNAVIFMPKYGCNVMYFPFNAVIFTPKYVFVYVYKHSKVISYTLCMYMNIYKYVPKSKQINMAFIAVFKCSCSKMIKSLCRAI